MPSIKSDEPSQNILAVNRAIFPHKPRRIDLIAVLASSARWILHFVNVLEVQIVFHQFEQSFDVKLITFAFELTVGIILNFNVFSPLNSNSVHIRHVHHVSVLSLKLVLAVSTLVPELRDFIRVFLRDPVGVKLIRVLY